MKIFQGYTALIAWAIFCGSAAAADPVASSPENTLIVPGKSIGDIVLGEDSAKVQRKLGGPDASDSAMGGQGAEEWYIGIFFSDAGRIFHRAGAIGLRTRKDMEHDSAAHPSPALVTEIYVVSARYATVEGIATGSTLDAIRAKYPDIKRDDAGEPNPAPMHWPLYGDVQFYQDTKQGIVFVIRKSDGVCVEIGVTRPGVDEVHRFAPLTTADYTINYIEGTVGGDTLGDGIKLGMTGDKLVALLGKPDEERDAVWEGKLWRWRIPPQGKSGIPALCIYLRKLPDGTLVADQIEVSSPAFEVTRDVFPGCPLKAVLQLAHPGAISKIESNAKEQMDIYCGADLGLLFDVRQADSICTAITIFPPQLPVHRNMGIQWKSRPPQGQK